MKVEFKDESPVRKTMRVEVPAEQVASATDEVLREYRKGAKLPGFRPGKAPLSVIRSRFGDRVARDVREKVVGDSFRKALRERGVHPVGDPELADLEHEEGGALSYRATFEVLPKIEVKNWEGLEVRRPPATVGEAEVDQALEQLRESRTRWVAEEGRRASTGDLVVADAEGQPDEGEPFRQENTSIEIGASNNLPAFNEKLEGVQAGQTVEFPVDYPAEFPAEHLAGRTVRYRVAVREVKRREVPELDDEFAKDLGEFDDLAALRERVRQDLEARKRHEASEATRQRLLEKLLIENPIVLPEVLIDAEIRHRLEEIVRSMMRQGVDPEKAEVDWRELRRRQEEPSRRSVHARLLLDALAAQRGVEIADDELDRRLREEAARSGRPYDEVRRVAKKGSGLQVLRTQMVREKTLDYLTSVANIDSEE